MDIMTIAGVIAAFSAILVGQYLEGGHISSLLNGPAMLIVFGGTLGAVMVQTPLNVFYRAIQMLEWMVRPPVNPIEETIAKVIGWSNASRREGLLGLEPLIEQEPDPFARKGL